MPQQVGGTHRLTEVDMTNESKKQKGTFGRVADAIVAWGKAMEYTHGITS